MEIKRIETYSLYEFCKAVQEAVVEGWRFDFESNELFPTAFGTMLVAGMVKAEDKPFGLTELVTETEEPAVAKRGRPSK